mmetsp:Transcript_59177/g.144657  ORF Transcript_59177/g.144657 Transcript_59177/m.144657 type:complete len:786 (+) Transcript_59177:280-2637(+)
MMVVVFWRVCQKTARTSLPLPFMVLLWISLHSLVYPSDCFTPTTPIKKLASPTLSSSSASLSTSRIVGSKTILCAETTASTTTARSDQAVLSSVKNLLDDDDDDDPKFETIRQLSEVAIYNSETSSGLLALQQLRRLCHRRIPYEFDNEFQQDDNDDKDQRMVARIPQLLTPTTTNDFLKTLSRMESNGFLSTNPDSVDGLPSLHLNLVSGGRPIVGDGNDTTQKQDDDDVDDSTNNNADEIDEFEAGIQELNRLIWPYLYEQLLPDVRQKLRSPNIEINDVFLRRYGTEVCGQKDLERRGISAHYDVFSRVTAVIALDDVAAAGQNGLYTTTTTKIEDKQQQGSFLQTSNHKALRRFFPLTRGDCVVHTWDVLHGVDVEEGSDRTSLIVWFTERDIDDGIEKSSDDKNSSIESKKSPSQPVSPWLLRNPDEIRSNDVLQFVLASAISSASPDDRSLVIQGLRSVNSGGEDSENIESEAELYLKSASRGNTFALTRMGSLCQEYSLTSGDMEIHARDAIEKLRPFDDLPSPIKACFEDNDDIGFELAMRCWLEGSIGGNPLAQRALGDELMFLASQRQDNSPETQSIVALASVLFALAAQQDDESALESLSRVIDYDLGTRIIESREDYEASPAVKVAKAAMEDIDDVDDDDEPKDNDRTDAATSDQSTMVNEEKKFKIVTCMSDSCCKKRNGLGMDPLSTFAAFYERSGGTAVQVEEGPCLGSCALGPCVGIEHEDFYGFVSLEGMTDDEFGSKAFHNVVTEEDADRVWSCVEDAVKVMAEDNS